MANPSLVLKTLMALTSTSTKTVDKLKTKSLLLMVIATISIRTMVVVTGRQALDNVNHKYFGFYYFDKMADGQR